MEHQHSHYVAYTIEDEGHEWQYYNCTADDLEHAEEQCLDAYPDCEIREIVELVY